MPETNKRTIAEVQSEYQQTCAKAGHLQYQLSVGQEELDGLNNRLKALNIEAAAIAASEEAAKKEKETKNEA